MKSDFKNSIYILLGILFLSTICVLSTYFFNFSDELSDNPDDWANFGSYVGGLLTPIFTVSTLIWLIYTFISQYEIQRKISRMANLEKQLDSAKEHLMEIVKIQITPVKAHKLYQRFVEINDEIDSVRVQNKDLILKYKNGKGLIFENNWDFFSFLALARNELGASQAKIFLYDEDKLFIRHHINTFVAMIQHFLLISVKLYKEGYDPYAIYHILSLFNDQMAFLHGLGILDDATYENYLLQQSNPYAPVHASVDKKNIIDALKATFPECKRSKINDYSFSRDIINDGKAISHIITHIETGEVYTWSSGLFTKT